MDAVTNTSAAQSAQSASSRLNVSQIAQVKLQTDQAINMRAAESRSANTNEKDAAERAQEIAEVARLSKEQFGQLVENLDVQAQILRMQLRFGYSDDISGLYLKIMDAKSGELVRQIPSEQAIKFMARMKEMAGLLLEERV
ncbi:MAG: flagellar protein FlaG [Helicobacteraceae bacterium]|jgi:flagellar protein FlaG|nr:flagellar protein FlaG [Helicobacteraceae bacterium]